VKFTSTNKKILFSFVICFLIVGMMMYQYFQKQSISLSSKTIKEIGLTAENFPIIDGATSTQPIRSLIACVAFDGDCRNWYETASREMFIRVVLSDTTLTSAEREKILTKIGTNSKTHEAYLKLIKGDIDIILVSTKPSEDEVAEAKKAGVSFDLVPIGLDGFIFLVNEKNTISNLNTSDIIDIYTGKVENWKQFTGIDSPITAYTRQQNSGSQELMNTLVMKDIPIKSSLKQERAIMAMDMLITGVEQDVNSIGYSLYYYKNNMIDKREQRPNVKLLSVDSIEPNPVNIASKTYPYTFNIYAVTRSDEPQNSPASKIKAWLTTEEGQAVIAQAGYVRLGSIDSSVRDN